METGRSESPQEAHMELQINEDVGAEIEDFLLLGILGIYDEARDLARTILWRHLRHFPVFAEISDFAIASNDERLQTQLQKSIRRESIKFDFSDEQSFLNAVKEILRERIPWFQVIAFTEWNSPISCHRLLVQMEYMVQIKESMLEQDFRNILKNFNQFLERKMLDDATRCFSILAHSTHRLSPRMDFVEIHRRVELALFQLLASLTKEEEDETEAESRESNVFSANLAYLRFLNIRRTDGHVYDIAEIDIEDQLQRTRQLLLCVFNALPDTMPRGQHLEFCNKLHADLNVSKRGKSRTDTSIGRNSAQRPARRDADPPRTQIPRLENPESGISSRGHTPLRNLRSGDKVRKQTTDSPQEGRTRQDSDEGVKMLSRGAHRNTSRNKSPVLGFEPNAVLPTQQANKQAGFSTLDNEDSTVSQRIIQEEDRPSPSQSDDPTWHLSETLRGFITQETFAECRDYCKANPLLLEEDLRQLQQVACQHLSQGKKDAASLVVERWLMLREANSCPDGAIDWMTRFVVVRAMQNHLEKNRDFVLAALEEKLEMSSLSKKSSNLSEDILVDLEAFERKSTQRQSTNSSVSTPRTSIFSVKSAVSKVSRATTASGISRTKDRDSATWRNSGSHRKPPDNARKRTE